MKSLLKIFKILTPKQMRICFLLILLMFLCAIFEAIGVGAVYPLINIIGNKDWLLNHKRIAELLTHIGITSHKGVILVGCIGVIGFYITKNLLVLLQTRLQVGFSLTNQTDYTQRLYAYYIGKPYLFHVQENSSKLIRNIMSGGSIVFSSILINTLALVTECITVLTIWLLLFSMDRIIALGVAIVLGPLLLIILKTFRKKITAQGETQKKFSAEYTKWLQQGLGAVKETKVMQKEQYFSTNFNKAYSLYTNASKDFLLISATPRVFVELTGVGGLVILVIIKILLGADPSTIVPSLGVLALAIVRLMPSSNRIIGNFNAIKVNMPLFNEMFADLLEVKKLKDMAERKIKAQEIKNMPFTKELEVKNITFAYPEKDKKVLDGISFTVPKGSFVGIVGPSGAGKTTFVDVMLGLLPPQEGAIYADGVDIYSNIAGWLYNVAYVPQSIYLIDGSIRENITLGVPAEEVTDERVEKALKMAELYDFVQTLPQKDKTKTGEAGARLSGGQRQRIGIARALFKNPEVLILDEATSALDNETERHITDTILKLKGQITIISIAHRLSTLEKCDFKIHFESGKAQVEGNA